MIFIVYIPKIIVFWYVNNLTINNQMFHSSMYNQVAGFLFRNPGTYSTNAYDLQTYPSTNIYYSERMDKVCNGYSEYISYYEYKKHQLNVIYGGGVLYIDNDIMNTNNNLYNVIKGPGYHSIRLFNKECHDPKKLRGGRFLTIWMYNMSDTSNKDNILESNILYGGDFIKDRGSSYEKTA